ncbi:cupin domain-containing protein [Haladaptatus sp. F3-133]|uniref:Cupin domain-containing protein n=1 Tax=Halorutilus salinus TaxID=2487751 RepID=A0A9Q4C4V1_9EURY|nr:cupin domain-containing protein [Halorutilus salinus]
MELFNVSDVVDEIGEGKESAETVRGEAVSLEVMRFEEGDEDQMHAHAEDEVYHIDTGTAKINVEGESTEVSEGDVIHLEPGTDHRFHGFEDELVMTVLYAPAKGSTE